MKTILAAAALAPLLAAPALASALPVATNQSVPVKISTAGLNLADHGDLAKLRNRVNKAVAEACNPADRFIITTATADRQCRDQALQEANKIVQRMAQAAVANQVAQH